MCKPQKCTRIKPGNSKTLWEAFKIASDNEILQIPNTMKLNNTTIQKDNIPETFANYFNDQIKNLANTRNIFLDNTTQLLYIKTSND